LRFKDEWEAADVAVRFLMRRSFLQGC